MSFLDLVGACFSLLSTYYFTQAKRFAWFLSLFAITLNIILYWQRDIYGQLWLEGYFGLSSLYGCLAWRTKHSATQLIRGLSLRQTVFYGAFAIVLSTIISQLLLHLTHSDIPYWDGTTAALSILAQWLLCLKIIHCWILWFIVDIMTAALYYHKGLIFHSILYWIYLILAVAGYYQWQRLRQQTSSALQQPLF